jgi:hypothetical protein
VSLYLRWVEALRPALGLNGLGINGLLDNFSGDFTFYDGWGVFGQAGALCALAVVGGAGSTWSSSDSLSGRSAGKAGPASVCCS